MFFKNEPNFRPKKFGYKRLGRIIIALQTSAIALALTLRLFPVAKPFRWMRAQRGIQLMRL